MMKNLHQQWNALLFTVLWCVVSLFVAQPTVFASDPPVTTGRWFPPANSGTPNYPADSPVVSMATDSQQRLWIGTYKVGGTGDGAAMFDGFTWTSFTNANTAG